MKKAVISAAVLLVRAMSLAQAGEWEGLEQKGELHGVIDYTFQSSYVWRGFDVFAGEDASQITLDLDLFQTGLGISVQAHRANSSSYRGFDRWDYTIYYQNRFFDGEPYATNYRIGWVYYNYPQHNWEDFDLQELHGIASFPNILGISGLVPSYVLVKLWPSASNSFVGMRSPFGGTASGFAHIFMLDYDFNVPSIFVDTPEQHVNLHSELVYNDGVAPNGWYVQHDWSNAVFGASTDIEIGDNVIFTPALWYQVSMEPSVNSDHHEIWATLSVRYAF